MIYIGAVYTTTVGEGNGKPIQYSCLEIPLERGALWAAVYGVALSRTWLKRLAAAAANYDCDNCASSVQPLSCVCLFVTPWTAAHQASLSIINSWNLLKLMPIESVLPSNISSSVVSFSFCLQSFPAPGSFQMSQCFPLSGKLLELQHQSFQWIFRTDFI